MTRWPRYANVLAAAAGGLIGHALMALIYGWPWWWAALLLGIVLGAGWWFGIASDAACLRRYERARIAAIHQRRREQGIGS